jgi:rhodanese-related sulfurtransferase
MMLLPPRKSIIHLPSGVSIAILAFAILSGCTTNAQNSTYPSQISPAQAKTEIQNGAMVLDVREQSEYSAGHIPGAVWIPLGDLASRLQELPKDRLIIVQCRTGSRSAQGRDLLLKNGFTKVTSLSGGILAWQAAGYSIEPGGL